MEWPASRRAIAKLVDEQYLPLYRYAYRLTGRSADAEDLVQEAFCQAQMRYHQLRDPSQPRGWLFAILRNAYLRRKRDEKGRQGLPLDEVSEPVAVLVDESPFPVDGDQLQAALGELPEGFRTPVILFYFEEFSYRDIADQMGVPVGTVMSRLARAKAHLRARLGRPEVEQRAVDHEL